MRLCRLLVDDQVVASKAEVAEGFWERFKGLLGRDSLAEGSALIITNCRSVHMFGMKFPIDVLFCDSSGTVVFLIENLKPWRISPVIIAAQFVVELPAGSILKYSLAVGKKVQSLGLEIRDTKNL